MPLAARYVTLPDMLAATVSAATIAQIETKAEAFGAIIVNACCVLEP